MRNDRNAPSSSFLSARSLHCYLVRTEDRQPSTVAAARPCARRPWRSSNPAPARRRPSATSPADHGAPATPHRRDGGPRDLARRSWRSGNPASGRRGRGAARDAGAGVAASGRAAAVLGRGCRGAWRRGRGAGRGAAVRARPHRALAGGREGS